MSVVAHNQGSLEKSELPDSMLKGRLVVRSYSSTCYMNIKQWLEVRTLIRPD